MKTLLLCFLIFSFYARFSFAQTPSQADIQQICNDNATLTPCDDTCGTRGSVCFASADQDGNFCAHNINCIVDTVVQCTSDADCPIHSFCTTTLNSCNQQICATLCQEPGSQIVDTFDTASGYNYFNCTHSSDGTLVVIPNSENSSWTIRAGTTRGYFYTALGCGVRRCYNLNQWNFVQVIARAPTFTDFHLAIRYTDNDCNVTQNFSDPGVYVTTVGDANIYGNTTFSGLYGNVVKFLIPVSDFDLSNNQLEHSHSIHFGIPPNTVVKLEEISLVN